MIYLILSYIYKITIMLLINERKKLNNCKQLKKYIRLKSGANKFDQDDNILYLWDLLLSDDKRSFTEYFKEEHNIDISDTITFKELLVLCKQYKLI